MAELVPTCVWRLTPALVVALDERFGEPVDTYVNGSQVWLRDDGPGGFTLEWRLHPVGGFDLPVGASTHDVFSTVALAVALGDRPIAPPELLWDGLEAFAAYGDEVEPAMLAAAAAESLGISPDAVGVVDHESIADAWDASERRTSIINALLEQLSPGL